MKPDSKSKTFRYLAQQLRDGCQRQGIDLDDGAAELILAQRVTAVAAQLRITDTYAMRMYFTDEAINELVEVCVQARAHQDLEVELASPMLLPIPHAATIIGALAASCEAATTAEHRAETTTAVREAAAAILRIAGAIARAGEGTPAILDALTAVVAHTQLSTMVDHLTDGSWHMPGHEQLPDARGTRPRPARPHRPRPRAPPMNRAHPHAATATNAGAPAAHRGPAKHARQQDIPRT